MLLARRAGRVVDPPRRCGRRWRPPIASVVAANTAARRRRAGPRSTLSGGIARLERELCAALFVRAGRAVRLTREGRTLLRAAERALVELAGGAGELAGDADRLRGRVTLAFLPTLGTDVVPRLIGEFRARHPGIRFDLVQGPHTVLLARLRAGEADLAFTSPLPDEAGLAAHPLGEEELCLALLGHPLADGDGSVALADAAGEAFVGYLPGYGLRGTPPGVVELALTTPARGAPSAWCGRATAPRARPSGR